MTPRLELRGLRNDRAGPYDLALPPGRCLAVMGPSGSGKSVLLRMIADLDPHGGEALLDGQPRSGMTPDRWRASVAYLAAEPGWWTQRVGDHFPQPDPALLDRLHLRPGIMDQLVRLCSTGERQRLALLRTLVRRPPVLLLDEPTASLDAEGTRSVEDLLREQLGRGAAIVLVTHDPAQAGRLGDSQLRLGTRTTEP